MGNRQVPWLPFRGKDEQLRQLLIQLRKIELKLCWYLWKKRILISVLRYPEMQIWGARRTREMTDYCCGSWLLRWELWSEVPEAEHGGKGKITEKKWEAWFSGWFLIGLPLSPLSLLWSAYYFLGEQVLLFQSFIALFYISQGSANSFCKEPES